MKQENTKYIIGFVIILLVIIGAVSLRSDKEEQTLLNENELVGRGDNDPIGQEGTMEHDGSMTDEAMMQGGDEMMEKDTMDSSGMMEGGTEGAMEGESPAMKKPGSYEAYSPSKLANAQNGDVVLFFKAAWCPTCRTLDKDIKNSLGDIPDGVTILEVDYDNSTDLKKKYGVTYQHTLVQVDANGNMITKWQGGRTLEDVVSNIL